MRLNQKIISFSLLFIFGFLLFTKLISSFQTVSLGNCQEFGHIHLLQQSSDQDFPTLNQPEHSSKAKVHDCNEGKSFFGQIIFIKTTISLGVQAYGYKFKCISFLLNFFNSPDIEPDRKPPKIFSIIS